MDASEKTALDGQNILVIDDEEVVRMLFQSLLEEEGYTTFLAQDGRQGHQMLEEHRPAVALVDKNLPDISGLDLIANEKKRYPDTEFIMITGYASLDSAVKAMEVGAFSYLTKPFTDMDVVLDRIRAALDVNRLRVETSQLRDRLDRLSDNSILSTPAEPSPRGAPGQATEQMRNTLAFLETFLSKREQPPTPSIWARTVDMIEEHCRLLRKALDELDSRKRG